MYENQATGSSVTVSVDKAGDYQISGVLEPGITIAPGCPGCPHQVQYSLSNEPADWSDYWSDYEQVEARYPRVRQGKGMNGGEEGAARNSDDCRLFSIRETEF